MGAKLRAAAALGMLAVLGLSISGCLGGGDDDADAGSSAGAGEVVITCEACPVKPTKNDPFSRYRKELTDAFNREYAGRYRIEPKPYVPADDADSAQHYQRAAATDTLPDLFTDQATVVRDVARSGKLVDFAPELDQDGWKSTFQPDAFASLTDGDAHVWGIPEQRDAVGIYYNKALFGRAGIAAFPRTWDELLTACSRLKDAGVIPFAMDGDWVTQLMWANLIGTRPGGAELLEGGIAEADLAADPNVVAATEFLKRLHTDGCVNKDAFSGDYNRAAAPFLQGQAAMIANGPWMIPEIHDAKIDAGYEPSPDDGLIVIPGEAGWASGAKDDAERAAVVAFMRFMTSDDQMLRKALVTGSYWPTRFEPSARQAKRLEPLSFALLQRAGSVTHTYPHAKFATPQAFTDAWINQWPAYVQGDSSTEDFLDALTDAVRRQR
jgi:raffinose/stachyose/melibiose transport system substrate-binding protein